MVRSNVSTHVFLETERLVLRPLEPADAELLFELDSDPEVRRYVHAGPPSLNRIREEVLPRMLASGFWAAEEKPARGFVGWFHLRPEPGEKDRNSELGFRLRRDAWGRGLATEGAEGLVANAFEESELRNVVAQTLAGNLASQRVLEKVGLQLSPQFLYEPPSTAVIEHPEQGLSAYRYVLTRERWRDRAVGRIRS